MSYRVLNGRLRLPGDKSVSHRSLMLLGLTGQTARISNLSSGQDVMSTKVCMTQLGCEIQSLGDNTYEICGKKPFLRPLQALDCGNSGTTIRLLSGILAGANIPCTLGGDVSLSQRPMDRVIDPLRQMGAKLTGHGDRGMPPLTIEVRKQPLSSIDYTMPMASAQVKSAILLAGLFAPLTESVKVREPIPSRNHTECMLEGLGVALTVDADNTITLNGRVEDMRAQDIVVPGDISSAAFWLVGAAICPGSSIALQQVSLNPTRLGILDVLKPLGVDLEISSERLSVGEQLGDVALKSERLSGDILIHPAMVPSLIDEIPILTILGLFNDGVFEVRGAEELRVKESDRLAALINLLKLLKVDFEAYEDGFAFEGNSRWQVPRVEAPVDTHHDHRLVMALSMLNLRAETPIPMTGKEWAAISYPSFFEDLEQLVSQRSVATGLGEA